MDYALADNYRYLSRYNRWFNERLYAACEALSDEERKRERGAFFGSIHHTLNHIMVGDRIWLGRMRECGLQEGTRIDAFEGGVLDLPAGVTLNAMVYPDWAVLKHERERLDAAIEAWTHEMGAGYPLMVMRYGNSKGVKREHPAWKAMTHFFNHQTHHRGQVTALLMQAGVDVGVTDMIALA